MLENFKYFCGTRTYKSILNISFISILNTFFQQSASTLNMFKKILPTTNLVENVVSPTLVHSPATYALHVNV